MKDIKVNWFPITFSDTLLSMFYKDSDAALEGHRLYRKIKVQKEDQTEDIAGLFLFEPNLKDDSYAQVRLPFVWENNGLIKEFIKRAIEKELQKEGYKTVREKSLLSAYNESSQTQIVPEFSVYDEYNIYPHFITDRRDKTLIFGIVVDAKSLCKFRVPVADLPLFVNRKIEFNGMYRGDLVSVNGIKAQVRVRQPADEKFKYEDVVLEVGADTVQPVGSINNFNWFCKKKYTSQSSELFKRLMVSTKAKTESGQVNQNILREKYEKICSFVASAISSKKKFSISNGDSTTFRVEHNSIGVNIDPTNELALSGERLSKREFVFGAEATTTTYGQFQGVRALGPLKLVGNVQDVKFLFIFPESKKEYANALFFALRNGLGPFPGMESIFSIPVNKENVIGLSVSEASSESLAENYKTTIERYIQENETTLLPHKALAFLIIPNIESQGFPNPYHISKAVLFKHGIASQAVEFDTIRNKNQFKWSIANMALAAFAKLGGIPWRLQNPEKTKQLIFGIGQKQLFDNETSALKRIVGYTVCVTADGEFHSVTTFKPAVSREEFLRNFKDQLVTAIQEAIKISDGVDELIIHFPKRSGYEEIAQVEAALETLSTSSDELLPYAILRITESEPFYLFDTSHYSCLPPEGTMAKISNNDAIVCIPGRQEKKSITTTPKYPLRVTQVRSTLTTTKFNQLLYQVYSLSGANWRAFNAREMPITIFYSGLIADLIANLDLYDVDFYDGLRSLEKIPWFL